MFVPHKPSHLVTLFLVAGFFYTFSYKLQSAQLVQEAGMLKHFFHPYLQCLTFFIGEALCAVVLYLAPPPSTTTVSADTPNINTSIGTRHSRSVFIVPALADLLTVMLQCTALALISGSTFMMLKGANIITTLMFSYWLFHFQIRSRHLLGCGLAVVGLVVVGLAEVCVADQSKSSTQGQYEMIGYFLMVLSLVFNGYLYAYEQKLMQQYPTISPLEMVGWEGIYGSAFSLVVIAVLSYIPCPYSGDKCVYISNGQAFIEAPSVYLAQIATHPLLLLFVVSGIIANAYYNLYGVTITQTMDSLTRSLLNICRTGLIWLFGIVVSLLVEGYRIESLSGLVNGVKLVGFGCIVTGTLVYGGMLGRQWTDEWDRRGGIREGLMQEYGKGGAGQKEQQDDSLGQEVQMEVKGRELVGGSFRQTEMKPIK